MRSIRFRIFRADFLLLILGLSVVAVFTGMLTSVIPETLHEKSHDGTVRIPLFPFFILGGGIIATVLGLVRIFVPGKNPALRAIDRAGPRRRVIAEIDAELKNAPVFCDKFHLTSHWLIFTGKLSVKIIRLDDLVLIHAREWQPEHRELLLCDNAGTHTAFRLDGFEISRLSAELRRARPAITFDDAPPVFVHWQTNPSGFKPAATPPTTP